MNSGLYADLLFIMLLNENSHGQADVAKEFKRNIIIIFS